jgi:hypothetical protein
VAFPVLLDPVGQAPEAPIFVLLDLAALAIQEGLEVGPHRVHQLPADVLARDQEMLVKSHIA